MDVFESFGVQEDRGRQSSIFPVTRAAFLKTMMPRSEEVTWILHQVNPPKLELKLGGLPGQRARSRADAAGGLTASRLSVCGRARMLCGLLNGDGLAVGRKQVATLMKKMGIAALYRKPNTS